MAVKVNSYFGEIEVLKQVPRKYSIMAAADCNLLTMNRNLLYTIISDFPLIHEEMRDIAEIRDKVNVKARKSAL